MSASASIEDGAISGRHRHQADAEVGISSSGNLPGCQRQFMICVPVRVVVTKISLGTEGFCVFMAFAVTDVIVILPSPRRVGCFRSSNRRSIPSLREVYNHWVFCFPCTFVFADNVRNRGCEKCAGAGDA